MDIKDNLEEVLEEIEEARKHSITGEEVKLIAVSKNHPVERINELAEYGCLDFGENKVQELVSKIPSSKANINYHMIGNLQTNKVKYIYDKVALIQSVDRLKLIKEINKRAKNDGIFVNILIQVNISREDQKGGVMPEDILRFLEDCLEYKNIRIKGLMGMAANTKDENQIRASFRDLFKIKEDIKSRNYEDVSMEYLSMGMSGDFKIAIEEGSNMVRIGTKIFGKREY